MGLSLVEVLVAMGIVAIMATALSKGVVSSLKFIEASETNRAKRSVLLRLSNRVSCSATFASQPTCSAGKQVALRTRDGVVLVSDRAPWSKITGLEVRAECLKSGEIAIKVAHNSSFTTLTGSTRRFHCVY